jgi:hypothetical protein
VGRLVRFRGRLGVDAPDLVPVVFLLVFVVYFGLIAAVSAGLTTAAYAVQLAAVVSWLAVAATGARVHVGALTLPIVALEALAALPLAAELSRRRGG